MGGGTGTGAGPVIAQAARERGILTVGVVTKPFHFEGAHRMRLAEQGIEELTKYVDTLIIIPNQNLFRIANEKTTFADAFNMADNVLHQGVRGVTDLMVMPGLINLDFADIRTVMSEMGKAMMGTGEASGEKRAVDAAESAIKNPLLDDMSMKGARGVLINITGGMDMTLFEVDEAANRIREEVDADANIIFGSTFDEKLDGLMRVSVVATGISAEGIAAKPRPQMTLVSSQVAPMQEGLSKEEGVITSPEKSIVSKQLKEEFTSERLKKTGTDDEIIDDDNDSGKFNNKVHTRFPPEPNGYLHIGHAKAICLNYNIAEEYNGKCNLRFDDTNPIAEEDEYVRSIQEDVKWLGFDSEKRVYFASDYFQQMYEYALQLIKNNNLKEPYIIYPNQELFLSSTIFENNPKDQFQPIKWHHPLGGKSNRALKDDSWLIFKEPKGAPIHSINLGKVVVSGPDIPGYGNLVMISHPNAVSYTHLRAHET